MSSTQALCAAALFSFVASCGSLPVKQDARLLEAGSGRVVTLEEAAHELSQYDVVFLGELHDSREGHVLMTELTALLLTGHHAPVLSMEMFERDVQDLATAYVDGRISREEFLAHSRPWDDIQSLATAYVDGRIAPKDFIDQCGQWGDDVQDFASDFVNGRISREEFLAQSRPYGDFDLHYGPVVDLARERDWDLVAANCPRSAARALSRGQHTAATASVFASNDLDLAPGRYRDEFEAAMGGMGGGHGGTSFDPMYAAQVLKDETMADSIARLFAPDGGPWPRVVHWNGRFHSDYGLGTAERLARRCPHVSIAIVTMERDGARALAQSEDVPGLYVIEVP